MKRQTVKTDNSLTDSAYDNIGEGLRVLARMIARRLVTGKPGTNSGHPRPVSPPGRIAQEASSSAPEGLEVKPASPQSDSRMLDAGYSGGKGGGGE